MSGIRLSGLSAADIARIAAAITADGWRTVEGHAVFQAAGLGVIAALTGTSFWSPSAVGAKKVLMRGFTATADLADLFSDNGTGGAPTSVGIGWISSNTAVAYEYASTQQLFGRWGWGLQLGSGYMNGTPPTANDSPSANVETGSVALMVAGYQSAGALARGLRAVNNGPAGATVKGSMYYSFEYKVIA